jgi:hypothetical protein
MYTLRLLPLPAMPVHDDLTLSWIRLRLSSRSMHLAFGVVASLCGLRVTNAIFSQNELRHTEGMDCVVPDPLYCVESGWQPNGAWPLKNLVSC